MTLNIYSKLYTFIYYYLIFCYTIFTYNIFLKYTFFICNLSIKNTKKYTFFSYDLYYNYLESWYKIKPLKFAKYLRYYSLQYMVIFKLYFHLILLPFDLF
jgi:hypothetical protein